MMSLPTAVIFAILIPFGIVGNILLMVLILLNKSQCKLSDVYMVMLAVSGLVHSVGALPVHVVMYLNEIPTKSCEVVIGIFYIGYFSSILLTAADAVDRWLFVLRPLRYESLTSPKKTAMICSGIWVYSLALAFSCNGWTYQASQKMSAVMSALNSTSVISDKLQCIVLSLNSSVFLFLVCFTFATGVFISVCLYSNILWLARKQAGRIEVLPQQKVKGNDHTRRGRLSTRQLRGVFLMLTSVLLVSLTWLPLTINLAVDSRGFTDVQGRTFHVLLETDRFMPYMTMLAVINLQMTVHPWLIIFAQKHFRKTIQRLCGGRFHGAGQHAACGNITVSVVNVE